MVISLNYHLAPKHPLPGALNDFSFLLGWVADNTGALVVSNRYVHKLFASTEMSLTKTISDKRTAQTARYLSDPGLRELSITDIAFMIGFNDSAYFSRVFKARYGLSPKQFRQRKSG